MACEDFPCCGHTDGDCPVIDEDGNQRWKCASCTVLLEPKSRSSLCSSCLRIELSCDEPYERGDYTM